MQLSSSTQLHSKQQTEDQKDLFEIRGTLKIFTLPERCWIKSVILLEPVVCCVFLLECVAFKSCRALLGSISETSRGQQGHSQVDSETLRAAHPTACCLCLVNKMFQFQAKVRNAFDVLGENTQN